MPKRSKTKIYYFYVSHSYNIVFYIKKIKLQIDFRISNCSIINNPSTLLYRCLVVISMILENNIYFFYQPRIMSSSIVEYNIDKGEKINV